MMFARMAVMWSLTACVVAAAEVGERHQGSICVTLASWKDEYVLGEPVLLVLSAKNVSDENVEGFTIYVDEGEPETPLFISTDGDVFKRCEIGIFDDLNIERDLNVLPPGQAWNYRLRVLYAREHPTRLAFPEPGRYSVKAVFPLMGRRPSDPSRRKEFEESGREEYESNTIEIRVSEPAGIDAKMWETVQQPAFLLFLQTGFVAGHDADVPVDARKDVPARAATLLDSVPHSSYHAAIRWALRKYYERQRARMTYLESQKNRELSRIRSALGIVEPPPGPFPDDARLDTIVTYGFPKDTPFWAVLEELSSQTRVPLSAAPELAERKCGGLNLKETKSLREFMFPWGISGAKWVPHGDGYRLVPAPKVLPPKILERLHHD